MSHDANSARSVSSRPSPSVLTSPAMVVMRRAISSSNASPSSPRRLSKASLRMISFSIRCWAVERRPGRITSTSSHPGTARMQPLDEGGADEPGRAGDGDPSPRERLGDHGDDVYHSCLPFGRERPPVCVTAARSPIGDTSSGVRGRCGGRCRRRTWRSTSACGAGCRSRHGRCRSAWHIRTTTRSCRAATTRGSRAGRRLPSIAACAAARWSRRYSTRSGSSTSPSAPTVSSHAEPFSVITSGVPGYSV